MFIKNRGAVAINWEKFDFTGSKFRVHNEKRIVFNFSPSGFEIVEGEVLFEGSRIITGGSMEKNGDLNFTLQRVPC